MAQRGAIRLFQDILSHLDAVLRSNSDEMAVKSRVVQLAQGNAVGDERLTAGFFIADDVSRIEQLFMAQAAESALPSISGEDPGSKSSLVSSLHERPGDILAARFGLVLHDHGPVKGPVQASLLQIIHGDRERQIAGIVVHDINRPGGKVLAFLDSEEIDEDPKNETLEVKMEDNTPSFMDRLTRLDVVHAGVIWTGLFSMGIAFVLTCCLWELTSPGQVGTGPYEQLVEEADVIALGEILSTDETRMAADGPMFAQVRVRKVVKGTLPPAIRFGASAWVGPTYQEGELRILFLQRIPPGHAYYQDAGWSSVEAGKLDLFFTEANLGGCSEDSLLSFLRSLQEVASAPPGLQLEMAQTTGSRLTLAVKFINDTGKRIWLNPSEMSFRFEANQVRRSLAVRWEDPGDSRWIPIPSGSALAGEASIKSQDVEGMSEITVTLDNRRALFPYPGWVGAQQVLFRVRR